MKSCTPLGGSLCMLKGAASTLERVQKGMREEEEEKEDSRRACSQ